MLVVFQLNKEKHMQRVLRTIPKKGQLTPLKLEHIFLFMLGVALITFGSSVYDAASAVGQIILLIIYLGLLVGIAPAPHARISIKIWPSDVRWFDFRRARQFYCA